MSSPAVRTAGSLLKPYRVFFRTSQTPTSIQQARAVFDSLRQYGDLIEYKFMRCSETQRYLNYGFAVYKNTEDGMARALRYQD
ncbi:hypothetical protein VTP01DRAFT_8816 [Rhizomucor pusillus]|uniref:uncharacterized protein n=1 Tax=Rhizomucor pusillus TaxID=4840 RepID=UPI0037449923